MSDVISNWQDGYKEGRRVGTKLALAERNSLQSENARLTKALRYGQHLAERIGTHGPGCADRGPAHYECLLGERDTLRGKLDEARELLVSITPHFSAPLGLGHLHAKLEAWLDENKK